MEAKGEYELQCQENEGELPDNNIKEIDIYLLHEKVHLFSLKNFTYQVNRGIIHHCMKLDNNMKYVPLTREDSHFLFLVSSRLFSYFFFSSHPQDLTASFCVSSVLL